jgi:hypothetical protein
MHIYIHAYIYIYIYIYLEIIEKTVVEKSDVIERIYKKEVRQALFIKRLDNRCVLCIYVCMYKYIYVYTICTYIYIDICI